jgi:hypothetical protein
MDSQQVDSPPIVNTSPATSISQTGATINGILTNLGSVSSVAVNFQWGTVSGNYQNETPSQTMTVPSTFSRAITGLTANTKYYFRTKAVGASTVYGSEISFTTAASEVSGTFGLNSGDSIAGQGSNVLCSMRFQNTVGAGTLTQLELKFNQNSAAGNVRMGIYADSGGKPGNLLLDAGTIAAGKSWVNIGSLNLEVTQGTYYWMAFVLSASNGGVEYQITGQPTNCDSYVAYSYSPLPSAYPAGVRYDSNPYVMRATVTN